VNKLFQNTAFNLGFWGGITLFALLNMSSYSKSYEDYVNLQSNISAGGYNGGFPFMMYKTEIGYLNNSYVVWSGLVGNILITLVFSFVLGLIFKFVWLKIVSRRSPLK